MVDPVTPKTPEELLQADIKELREKFGHRMQDTVIHSDGSIVHDTRFHDLFAHRDPRPDLEKESIEAGYKLLKKLGVNADKAKLEYENRNTARYMVIRLEPGAFKPGDIVAGAERMRTEQRIADDYSDIAIRSDDLREQLTIIASEVAAEAISASEKAKLINHFIDAIKNDMPAPEREVFTRAVAIHKQSASRK